MVRKRRRGYKQYEARLIQLLRWLFKKANLNVDDHLKIGRLPLEIDLIVRRKTQKEIKTSLPRLFRYFRRYNVLELKTEQTPVTPGDLLKLQAYAWLYMEKHEIYSIAEVTATIIAHHVPPAVRRALPALGYKRLRKGIFKCRHSGFACYLIFIEDLPDELVPEELQIFSNPKRRERVFLSSFGKKTKRPLMDAMKELYESEVLKLMALYNFEPSFVRKVVKTIGKKKLSAAFSKEDHLAALNKKDIIAALGGKERLLKALIADLSLEQRQKLLLQSSRNGAAKRQNGKSKVQ